MIIKKKEIKVNKLKNSVFIYPTDTIYGIGCNALNSKTVKRIRRIKKRDKKPFSVIAPSKKWIYENCIVDKEMLKKLPGPYTLIFKMKKQAVAKEVSKDSVGVRIPRHWFSDIVKKLDFPVVTTSVNIAGKKHMTSLKDLDESIKKKVDFIIYEGKKKGRPSNVIDCRTKKIIRL